MNTFYDGPDREKNFEGVLKHWLSIFSEGGQPIMPLILHEDGMINKERTFEAPCFADFPASEKQIWLDSDKEQAATANPK